MRLREIGFFKDIPRPTTPRAHERTGRNGDLCLCGACLTFSVWRYLGRKMAEYTCTNEECNAYRAVPLKRESAPHVEALLMANPKRRGEHRA